MPEPKIETLWGSVDGANRVFHTPVPYVPGTVRVFVNDQLRMAALEGGWVELGGDAIELKKTPMTGDRVRAFYERQV